mgnify:CR=1 FL=1
MNLRSTDHSTYFQFHTERNYDCHIPDQTDYYYISVLPSSAGSSALCTAGYSGPYSLPAQHNPLPAHCCLRLRWPWNLTEKAKAPYREFLAAHTGLVLQRLLKAQDTDSIKDLLALDVLDAAAFAEGAALAAKADNAAAAALLADAEHKKRGSAPKKRRYDFDF